jgi:hypothetical protein
LFVDVVGKACKVSFHHARKYSSLIRFPSSSHHHCEFEKKYSTLFNMMTKTFFPQKLYFFLWLYWWGKRGEKKRVECETAHFGERKCTAGAPLQPIVVDTSFSLFLIFYKPTHMLPSTLKDFRKK